MKKIYFFVLFLLATTLAAEAQTAKGNMMIGGTVTVESTSNQNDSKGGHTIFSPSFGYFISDNLAVGAGIGYDQTTSETGGNNNVKYVYTTTSFTPFIRYYKFTSSENFAFFATGSIGINGYKEKTDGDETYKSNGMSIGISPGFAFFFNKHWAVDFSVTGLKYSTTNPEGDDNNSNSVSFVASLSPSITLRYHFGN